MEAQVSDPLRHVLVTGAAGLLGRKVVERLRADGVTVTALELEKPDDLDVDRLVIGSAGEEAVVREALDGVDGVVHLAALRSPDLGTAQQVFIGNTSATFNVLEEAARAGVRRAVIASSYSITGMPFAPHDRHPAYLPIDEQLPLQVEDPYALSKQVDERTAEMMWWRHGLSVCALRYPFLGSAERELPERAASIAEDPSFGAREFWTYLETRDAAAAAVRGLTRPAPGFVALALAAPVTLAPYPTAQLLDWFHPNVPRRRPFSGRSAPVDTSRARAVLDWRPEFLWPSDERDLDASAMKGKVLR
jgi:nucleoside-diphosphate-sugar epimerase